MADRSQEQLDWESGYLTKVERIQEILHQERMAIQQANSQPVYGPTPPAGSQTSTPSASLPSSVVTNTVAGNYSLPSTIKVASIAGGHVTIPTGQRTPYHQARDVAAQNSKYAGFQSISESMYTFPNCEEENMFSPDFIPILTYMYQKIAPALGVDKIKLNSGTRKKPVDVEWDAHMGGYAVDMGLTGDDRYTAADICWEMGLRGVAIARTFVHVDAGPDPVVGWSYSGIPAYRGPGSARG